MEALAQQLQDALNKSNQQIAVYLGSEWLDKEMQLPHVIVLPGDATYGASEGRVADAIATVMLSPHFICRAALFEEAALLADFCYSTLAPGKPARMTLRTETWSGYYIRTADLTVNFPATLLREDITRVAVKTFTEHAQFINPNTTQEVPQHGTNRPTGSTDFLDHHEG